MVATLVARIFSPAYSMLVGALAYGPWGIFHQLFIRIFCSLYKIEAARSKSFRTLGDFFLRDRIIKIDDAPIVCPADGLLLEGPISLQQSTSIVCKGLEYRWNEFPELRDCSFEGAKAWNIYLSPPDYHWVHSPANGENLEAFYHKGYAFPVNEWGRKLAPALYITNERLTFRFKTEEFGQIFLICVGAMAVRGLISAKGEPGDHSWKALDTKVKKGERLLGFKLGSSVLVVIEKPPATSHESKDRVEVGHGF